MFFLEPFCTRLVFVLNIDKTKVTQLCQSIYKIFKTRPSGIEGQFEFLKTAKCKEFITDLFIEDHDHGMDDIFKIIKTHLATGGAPK